jgi:hypothetical protein
MKAAHRIWLTALALGGALWLTPVPLRAAVAPEAVDYGRQVRQLIADRCYACHGPDEARRKADLRLDLRDAALKPAKGDKIAIVPGKPDASELMKRITSADPDVVMPPPESKKTPLTPEEQKLIGRWIAEGAPFTQHWSFIAPQRPKLPRVQNAAWPVNEIDYFVLEALERNGLQPSKPADRHTLIRRLYLDMLGIPPSIAEVDAFVNDTSTDAYEKLVDRVLENPRYGEKMALRWLDLARFGDTSGYHMDSTRQMWLWRNYVIDSYNSNKPFDQFTIEQLAGDLLPNPTLEQKIGSGFNRNSRFNEEGGADPLEFQVTYSKDRVFTLGGVWLGLTTGCAECHSHKYDPITQHEYYQLYAFFNNINDPMVSMNHNQPLPPLIKVQTPEQLATIATAQKRIEAWQKEAADALAKATYEEPAPTAEETSAEPTEFVWVEDDIPAGGKWAGDAVSWVTAPEPVQSGARSMKRTGAGFHQNFFEESAKPIVVGAGDRVFAYVYLDPASPPKEVMLQFNVTGNGQGWEHRAFWGADVIGGGTLGSASRFRVGERPEPGKWVRLEADAASLGLAPGTAVHGMAFSAHDGTVYFDKAGFITRGAPKAQDVVWIEDEAPAGAKLEGNSPWEWVTDPKYSGAKATKRTGKGQTQHYFTGAKEPLAIQAGDKLFAYVYIDPLDQPKTIMLQFNDGAWEHRAYWGADEAYLKGQPEGPNHHRIGDLPKVGEWVRLEVDIAAVGLPPGAKLNGWAFSQADGTVYWDHAGVNTLGPPDSRHLQSLLAWEKIAPADDKVPGPVKEAIKAPAEKRTDEQKKSIRDHYLRYVFAGTRETFDPLNAKIAQAQLTVKAVEEATPTTMVSEDLTGGAMRKAFLLVRGDFLNKGDEVQPGTPAALPAMKPDYPKNRLGLAKWLVDGDHPLTARVAVNRLWHQCFGAGIVRSMGDFGTQGEYPTHPKLLDWLATEFVRNGWDTKLIFRKILTSAAYRQAPLFDAKIAAHDPADKLLYRAPRFRLGAEEVRDNALQIAGMLGTRIGGPSVNPYQPDGYYNGKMDSWKWVNSAGEDVYRRGLYTFWRRTTLYPSFQIFDAPNRDVCTVDRPRTNTPLQALVTLNDPTFVEAARVFAQRVLTEAPPETDARLVFAFRSATARPPTPAELATLRSIYQRQSERFKKDPSGAAELVAVGQYPRPLTKLDPVEHATWAAVANVLLNLDETITRE